ncbi:MAG TPA: sulfatase-like hydrolase/transferase [Candidatus Avidesulfovibrio excrementigallinarum]|nr:sulfatase-like hydrolase/transferase [Candidatus Avidesulfovibrio excrementigallinarum]
MRIPRSPVQNGSLALLFLLLSVAISGLEALAVQTLSITHRLAPESFGDVATGPLLLLDFLAPLALALLSRGAYLIFVTGQTFVSSIVLHYGSFFYNTLTLSTIYHSMQGLSYLGNSVFTFMKADVILVLAVTGCMKIGFLWLSARPHADMPPIWQMRRVVALLCLMVLSTLIFWGHGRTGILSLWTGESVHRTAIDRRTQDGTRESVRHLGYLATWMGEWLSGVYRDTSLIYAEKTCPDPHARFVLEHPEQAATWNGLPLPSRCGRLVMIQVESLDFAALSMRFNKQPVMPFLETLLPSSLVIRAFAPHKVGSANSDYELLNGRIAEQNVMYYSYIRDYPDSVVHLLAERHPAAFHGLEGNLFNLRGAYARMGFCQTFFKEELVRAGYPISNLTMEQVADGQVLDAAVRYMEQGRGQAVFVVTMSSHIPFMDPWPPFGLGKGLFARYAASLRYVDTCLADMYARLPEGTLLILWGDHSSDIPYPEALPPNGRHVPFLVHVKGDSAWLEGGCRRSVTEPPFTLCELSHLLRRLAGTQATICE